MPTFPAPANPVSALVAFEVIVRPLIRIALGKRQPMRRTVQALRPSGDRRSRAARVICAAS